MTDRTGVEEGQPELVPGLVRAQVKAARTRAAKQAASTAVAAVDPVARVLVDTGLAHLDRTFDYLVPATIADGAQPGCRVKVRFAGKDVDGLIVERTAASEHDGRLAALRRLVSDEPVLQPQILALIEELAATYAGTRGDLLRLAVPPRHATVEAEPRTRSVEPPPTAPAQWAMAWQATVGGPAFLRSLATGESPVVVWDAPPGLQAFADLTVAVAATRASGRGALVIVPDAHDADRLSRELGGLVPDHVVLRANAGPAQRYRDFLTILRGEVQVVIGTRAAAFAPVVDLGLAVIWDDGDAQHQELRAPYPHAREVLRTRSEIEGCALVVAGHSRSTDAQVLVRTSTAAELPLERDALRAALTVRLTGASDRALERDPYARSARIPQEVTRTIRDAVERGPVLVQTPRQGYAAALACERCRTPARCRACEGPLQLPAPTSPPSCAWCGTAEAEWSCRACGHRGLRAPIVGESRTAEELGRAFPGVTVHASGGASIKRAIRDRPHQIVVATPGAEPVVGQARQLPEQPETGYAAVILLDTWLMLTRPDLRVREEALRRWMSAASLGRRGASIVAVGDPADPSLQALVRWDPAGHAERELADRASAHMPPASRVATITGTAGAVDDAMTLLAVPPGAEVLGPAEHGEGLVRTVIRVPWSHGPALSAALGELHRLRSARRLDPVRIQVDPPTL